MQLCLFLDIVHLLYRKSLLPPGKNSNNSQLRCSLSQLDVANPSRLSWKMSNSTSVCVCPGIETESIAMEKGYLASCHISIFEFCRFENDRTISFIPPDGEFELMSYRLNTHVKVIFHSDSSKFNVVFLNSQPLIWIESVIERHAHSRIEIMVKAKSQFKRRLVDQKSMTGGKPQYCLYSLQINCK